MHLLDHRGTDDSVLRQEVNNAIFLYNKELLFYADEHCSYIWNVFFSGDGIYQSDRDIVKCLIGVLQMLGNTKSANTLQKVSVSVFGSDQGESKVETDDRLDVDLNHLPKVQSILTEDMRIKIRDLFDPNDSHTKFSRKLNYNYRHVVEIYKVIHNCFENGKEENLRIMDIGTGYGLLPYIFTRNGHTVETLDIEDTPTPYDQACEIFGIKKHTYRIERFKPLMKFEEKFDAIVSTKICFNDHNSDDIWRGEEWRFFLKDVFENHLNKKGIVWLHFNRTKEEIETGIFEYGHKECQKIFSPFNIPIEGSKPTHVKLTYNDLGKLLAT